VERAFEVEIRRGRAARPARVPRRRDRRTEAPEPLPADAGVELAAGGRGRGRRQAADQPLLEQLPRSGHASSSGGSRPGRDPRVRRWVGRGADDRRRHEHPRAARNRAGGVQARRSRPDVPIGIRRQHGRDSGRDRRGRSHRLRCPQPRLDHRRHAHEQGAAGRVSAQGHGRAARAAARGPGTRPGWRAWARGRPRGRPRGRRPARPRASRTG
jgi:hypothetical protein